MNYPEHEKLRAIKGQSQSIGSFLDWLEEGGYSKIGKIHLACYDNHGDLCDVYASVQDLLAAYFGIDRQKLEQEKLAMLDELRKAHDET